MKKAMNNRLSKLLFLPLFILIAFTSCQNEVSEITDSDEQQVLVANSQLANLMQFTSQKDGSFDNIIDYANCISVNLPVTVIVNGLEITIDSEEDLAVIEAIFDEFSNDDDNIEIIFPITIVLNDHTEVVINNYDELEVFIAECNGENQDDDDIECIDFQYPITISVFNSDFQVIDTITINSDEELYEFIEDLEGGLLASINFPVTMILADGSELVVNNNAELQDAIEAAEDTCDEDDDNDYNDDDVNIPIDDLAGLLKNCTWKVDKLEVGDQNLEGQYEGYVFTFNENGTVVADINGNFDEGTWELIDTDAGIKLNLQMANLTDFNNEMWLLHEIEDGDGFKIDFRNGADRLRFKKYECETSPAVCPEEVVDGYLMECLWRAGFNGNNEFGDYEFNFNANQALVVHHSVTDEEVVGTWTTSVNTDGATVLTLDIGAPLGDFAGEWTVIDCGEGRIKIVSGDLYIVFERECPNDGICDEAEVDARLKECDWKITSYAGDESFNIFKMDFKANDDLVIFSDTEEYTAGWTTAEGTNGVEVTLSSISGGNVQILEATYTVVECTPEQMILHDVTDSSKELVLDRVCN